MTKKAAVIFCCFTLLASVSCTKKRVVEALDKREDAQLSELRKIRNDIRHKNAQDLTWSVAVERLLRDNEGLKRSRRSLATAKKAKADSFRSLVPRVTIFFGLTTLISDISDLSFQDVTGQANANFSIPSPFAFYAQLYVDDINAISADWSHELDRRRAFRELYVAFRRAQDLENQRVRLESEKKQLSQVSLTKLTTTLKQVENSIQNYERNYQQSRTSFNNLLGTPGGHWRPVGPLPNISYADRFEDYELGENIGKLGLKLEAAQIETSHLAVRRIKLQRWPAITFGLSGPPIFSTRESSRDFVPGNFNLFSGLGETIDITDPLDTERIQDAEIRLEATISRMRQSTESEIVKFEEVKINYRSALREKRILQKRMRALENSAVTSASALLENFQEEANLQNTLRQVELKIDRLNLEYWVWDDNAWR